MLYTIVLNILMLLALLLAFIKYKSKSLFVAFAVSLALIAGLRDGGLFYDYGEYLEAIQSPGESRMEFTFRWMSSFVNMLGLPPILVFLFYAGLGVGLKAKAILSFRVPIWFALMTYMAHMFSLEECTAIRVGVATGFVLLAFCQLCRKRYLPWLVLTLVAASFHYSALLALSFPLIVKIPVNLKVCVVILIAAYLVPLLGWSVGALLQLFHNDTLDYYSHYLLSGEVVNIFNFSQIFYCAIALYVVKHIKQFRRLHPFSDKLILVYLISLVFLPIFYSVPVFAFRGAHIFACSEIFLFPLVIKYFWRKKRIFYMFVVIAYLFYWCNISLAGAMV